MLTCHLLDEGSDRLVNEVSFEFIPIDNQATGASLLELEEGAQGAKDMVGDGPPLALFSQLTPKNAFFGGGSARKAA